MNRKKIAITKPVNGISLNGDEYLLNESSEVMTFNNKENAITFLIDNGLSNEDIEYLTFVEMEV